MEELVFIWLRTAPVRKYSSWTVSDPLHLSQHNHPTLSWKESLINSPKAMPGDLIGSLLKKGPASLIYVLTSYYFFFPKVSGLWVETACDDGICACLMLPCTAGSSNHKTPPSIAKLRKQTFPRLVKCAAAQVICCAIIYSLDAHPKCPVLLYVPFPLPEVNIAYYSNC